MIKDKQQKQLAVKLCAAQGMIPFVEVIVHSQTGLEDSPSDITDIDVVGVEIGKAGTIARACVLLQFHRLSNTRPQNEEPQGLPAVSSLHL